MNKRAIKNGASFCFKKTFILIQVVPICDGSTYDFQLYDGVK